MKTVVAWVRFLRMPVKYYHENILQAIDKVVRTTVKVDMNTQLANRGKFTRVAVKLNLVNPLVTKIHLDGFNQHVEYEGLPKIFFTCG
ncbi:hypothetical protein RCOM_0935160 [Ricinus communis]|uniref:Uncharacterized protein n=1 Tax=Ricinus communis TaxID=3988 RepID=B9RZ52_RICCO|nr:hypothetical protein RCOM_0935160 [Ricinus communis]